MKQFVIFGISVLLLLFSCKNEDTPTVDDLTGKSKEYPLFAGSEWNYQGVVKLAERTDGFTRITITLDGPRFNANLPTHLHYGSYTQVADMAAMLAPVNANDGIGITDITELLNGDEITYEELIKFDGHIKVHLDDGPNKTTILAYGNIGTNPPLEAGRIATCSSE